MIVHTMLPDGGFVSGDTETRLTCYAYPTSTHATEARKRPNMVADEMMAGERASTHRSDYDARNWEHLNAAAITPREMAIARSAGLLISVRG